MREVFCEPGPLRELLLYHLRENAAGQFFVDDVFDSLPRGCVLGRVDLVACIPVAALRLSVLPMSERYLGDYGPGHHAWPTRNPHRLVTPIPYRGRQGLWTLPDEVLEGPLEWGRPGRGCGIASGFSSDEARQRACLARRRGGV